MSLKHGLLGLLQKQPMTGYELKKTFNESLNYFWHAQTSQIYRDLGNLEKKGLVKSKIQLQSGKPDKRIYTITDEGIEDFNIWMNECNFSSTLIYRDSILMKLFFGNDDCNNNFISGFEDYILTNEEQILEYKRTRQWLHSMENRDNEAYKNLKYIEMTLSRGIITAKSNIEWANECLLSLRGEK